MPALTTKSNQKLSALREDARRTESCSAEPLVEILMSTHNGEKFLAVQMDSLVAQTYKNWRLIVRDDASGDASVRIIEEYCRRYPDQISLVSDEEGQLGPCRGFARVLKHAAADYMMFCDQDDLWLPQKVELSVTQMLKLEKENPETPILVFTDLTVVDEELNVLSDSFWHYQRINPHHTSPNLLIFDNVATGCTMMFNKRLKDISEPIPVEAVMHDWWFALVCSIHGRLGFLNDKTVLYRQHGRNDLGAQNNGLAPRARRFWKSPKNFVGRTRRIAARTQAQKLLEHAQTNIMTDSSALIPLQRYLQSRSLLQRKWCLVRYGMLSGHYIKWVRRFLFC
jgi:glycosyltransferase involved in cell wall biosynthesis